MARKLARPDPWVTAEEFGGMIRIPVATIYVWRHRGKAPESYKFGRHVRFRFSAVVKWVEENIELLDDRDPDGPDLWDFLTARLWQVQQDMLAADTPESGLATASGR